MNKIVLWIGGILIIIGGIYAISIYNKESEVSVNIPNTESVLGCYVATLSKDVYSLKISSQDEEKVSGTLVFKNFQKDSSQGTFSGTYKDGILFGNYNFRSEGTDSVMQIVFKKSGDDFIRGYGDFNEDATQFSDLGKVNYDPNQTFKKSATCATSL